MKRALFKSSEKITLVMIACAIGCVFLSLALGALAALYYMPEFGRVMQGAGISLVQLRPLHTTFASAWIYLGAVTCVFAFLFREFGEPTPADKLRFKLQMVCWGLAGLGILVTLPLGITTGREYLGFHPAFSLLIVVGWLLFAWTFFSKVRRDFWSRPVYVYMWATGIVLFLYTFLEGHAWLLRSVRGQPVVDLQIQWKSCGTLVAAFNQMVYGSLIYLVEKTTGDERTGQSKRAFALLGVGLLNSFTNYAHHTYHLPQSHLIKWIAFCVSMLEVILLVGVYRDAVALMRRERKSPLSFNPILRFVELSKCWNLFLLSIAILISIPPLNALIHGTHVVMAHAMGSELAIDSYILFAVVIWLLVDIFPKREVAENLLNDRAMRTTIVGLNISLVVLVSWLLAGGLATGVTRYLGEAPPAWLAAFPYVFAAAGFGFAYFLLRLLFRLWPFFSRAASHKTWYGEYRTGPDS